MADVKKIIRDVTAFSGTISATDDTVLGTHDNGDGTSTDFRYALPDLQVQGLTPGTYANSTVVVGANGNISSVTAGTSAGVLFSNTVSSKTTTFTVLTGTAPPPSGNFTVGCTLTVNSVSGSVAVTIAWTDENSNSRTQTVVTAASTGQAALLPYTIFAKGGTSITVSATVTGTANYNASAYITKNF